MADACVMLSGHAVMSAPFRICVRRLLFENFILNVFNFILNVFNFILNVFNFIKISLKFLFKLFLLEEIDSFIHFLNLCFFYGG